MALGDILREALSNFFADVDERLAFAREPDLVNRFAFGYLAPLVRLGGELRSLKQLAVEGTVPHHPLRGERSLHRDTDKDVVIWPDDCGCVRDDRGLITCYPMAIVEWKTLCASDSRSAIEAKKNRQLQYDIPWLEEACEKSPTFTGYAALLDVRPTSRQLDVTRVRKGSKSNWLHLPANR